MFETYGGVTSKELMHLKYGDKMENQCSKEMLS